MISDDIDPVSFASDSEHSRSYDMGYNAGRADAIAARDAEWVAALVEIEKESEALWLDDPSNEVSPSQAWTQSLEWLLIRMTGLGLLSDELKARMTGEETNDNNR